MCWASERGDGICVEEKGRGTSCAGDGGVTNSGICGFRVVTVVVVDGGMGVSCELSDASLRSVSGKKEGPLSPLGTATDALNRGEGGRTLGSPVSGRFCGGAADGEESCVTGLEGVLRRVCLRSRFLLFLVAVGEVDVDEGG